MTTTGRREMEDEEKTDGGRGQARLMLVGANAPSKICENNVLFLKFNIYAPPLT